ncbi:cytochrome b561 domain-containing protein 1 [Rhinatrema bivittatum]|uniref:cytochrome b561 domain-containing protein 1 n=1 Tax=Rhinatrema bivittatum TaxID=194408 RepID=UPI001126DDC2|nr:cytochrome b561 domain-containing protein 1 [Rhinatrema bivittatum]
MAGPGALQPLAGSESQLRRFLRAVPGFLAHLVAFSFTAFLLLLSRPGTSLFSWHPVFMALAFCLCLTEAILLLSPENSPFCFCTRKTKLQLHWIGHGFVILFAAAGLIFIVSSKNRSEQQHFTSWHSILGAITILAACAQAICGVFVLFPKLVKMSSVARLKLYHITCGLIIYLLATFTVLLGVASDWFHAQIKGVLWYLCLLIPLFPALIIMNQVLKVYLSKKKLQI